jgi:NADH-quinone oxidoreductase subunit L
MGGLRKTLKLEYACFMVGGAALSALPLITAGFYSKDEILWAHWALTDGPSPLFYAGLVGAFMTSLYTFRLIFTVFHGEEKTHAHAGHGVAYALPLIVLMVLSTGLGAMIHPPLAGVLPASPGAGGGEAKHTVEIISSVVGLAGIGAAMALFLGRRSLVNAVAGSSIGRFVSAWWKAAFGFDALYNVLFVQPFLWMARPGRRDTLDRTIGLLPATVRGLNRLAVLPQTGRLRWYVASMAIGASLVLAAVMLTLN